MWTNFEIKKGPFWTACRRKLKLAMYRNQVGICETFNLREFEDPPAGGTPWLIMKVETI